MLLPPNLSTRHFLRLERSLQSPLALHLKGHLLQNLPRLLLPPGKLAAFSKPLSIFSVLHYALSVESTAIDPGVVEEHRAQPLTSLTA